ncbi:hypothetical protein [Sporomusa rhizae]|uniref:hypothetical protein n=1 Tax=Sporomusa rhizae TaxID=357999 RepID=UPI00352B475C
MKKSICLITFLLIGLLCVQPISAADDLLVAEQWAPVIRKMDNKDSLTAQTNMFTAVDYDHDWRLNNNWYNLMFYPPKPAVYYSVVESDTHYFLGYYQYYPRHMGRSQHEHDLTGVLLAVGKTPDGAGRLEMLLTYSNHNWQKQNGAKVRLEGGRPVLKISAGTHEIAVVGKRKRFLPGEAHIGYSLIPLTQLWEQRREIGQGRVFAGWGYFDSYNAVKVTAPWLWDYHHINWLTNPGELFQYLSGTPIRECNYLINPYIK